MTDRPTNRPNNELRQTERDDDEMRERRPRRRLRTSTNTPSAANLRPPPERGKWASGRIAIEARPGGLGTDRFIAADPCLSDPIHPSTRLISACLLALLCQAFGFQSLIPSFQKLNTAALENKLLEAIDASGRLENSDEISSLVKELESAKSISRPAIADEVYGRWRLLQTTNADTASPIQRKAVDTTKFDIFQDIVFSEDGKLLVRQIVKFSDRSELAVDALASTSAYPLEELTDREGDGKILGLNILGVSFVGDEAQEDQRRPDSRIRFVFDEGNFKFGDLKIPYPHAETRERLFILQKED
ncbi:hypothetical protein THAOC_32343 [Thalassiosira oceanica]|uniref:Plastid lipid-associated protein/fibrillin conserved domain-containing protein n=1 Tax=Thalassiosira oceanica TaxID=159749 RepID=K0R9D8_THAOC|nr:hypothetical protein THAOC_32343 [Thalassiosira oceanica]|eukprot:EJK48829.1 hypothetical protein THAOC_32343 [Thalassiosira oceanica]